MRETLVPLVSATIESRCVQPAASPVRFAVVPSAVVQFSAPPPAVTISIRLVAPRARGWCVASVNSSGYVALVRSSSSKSVYGPRTILLMCSVWLRSCRARKPFVFAERVRASRRRRRYARARGARLDRTAGRELRRRVDLVLGGELVDGIL